jgi:hypothetical protein
LEFLNGVIDCPIVQPVLDQVLLPTAAKGLAGAQSRAFFQNREGMGNTMHPVVIRRFTREESRRYQIPDPLWQRFKIALNRVRVETAGAVLQRMIGK